MGIDQYINKIICGDCLEVMREMPDGCVDLVLTDPPYGIGVCSKGTWGGQLHLGVKKKTVLRGRSGRRNSPAKGLW